MKNTIFKTAINSILIFTLLFIIPYKTNAQQAVPIFNFKLKPKIFDGTADSSAITITKDGEPFKIISATDTSNFQQLELNHKYLFTCTKVGYITKTIYVDTYISKRDSAKIKQKSTWVLASRSLEIAMYKQPKDTIVEIIKPFRTVKYSDETENFEIFKTKYTVTRTQVEKTKTIVKDTSYKFNFEIQIAIDNETPKGSLIKITKDGVAFGEYLYDTSVYKITLDMNAKYLFSCTKNGYVSKSIMVNTHIPKGKDDRPFKTYTATIMLEKQPDNKIITILQPVGNVYFNYRVNTFSFAKADYETAETLINNANKK